MLRAGLLAVSLMVSGWALPGAAQPSLVQDVNPQTVDPQRAAASLSGFTSLGSRAVLVVGRDDEEARELWTTDGTDAGTERLRTFVGMDVSVVGSNGRIAFVLVSQRESYPQRPSILWRTDGTAEGTYAVSPTLLTFFSNAVIHQGSLVFSTCLGETDCEPWVSDGTVGGTRRLRDITPGEYGSDPREFLSVGDRLYFFATAPDGPGLWQTDLTRRGTRRVALLPLYSVPRDLKAAGGRLFFIVGKENSLWTSDGTAEGTGLVPPFDRPRGRGPAALLLLGAVGESEFFTGFDPALGVQVYRTDGTPGGTRRLTSFPRTEPEKGEVTEAAALPDRLLFVGLDGQLWASAGSRASTHPLTGCAGGCPAPYFGFLGFSRVAAGGLLFFAGSVGGDVEPWATDGTADGTRRLLEICANGSCGSDVLFGPATGGRVLFAAARDLWSTDGTAAGTRKVGEGVQVPDQAPLPVAAAGSRLVFSGFDKSAAPGSPIPRLKSSAGTLRSELVLSLSLQDGQGSSPTAFTALGDDILFFSCSSPGGIWKTRGTPETTVRLTDAQGLCLSGSTAQSFAVLGGVAYFAAFGSDGSPGEAWRTDGTPEGTWPISHVGVDSKYVSALTVFQGRLFFVAEDLDGDVHTRRSILWSSDGTAAGSAPLFDLPAIYVFYLSAFENALYFEGEDRESFGNNLYRSDGTAAGTHVLVPAGLDAPPRFLRFGGQLFIADAGNLWKTDGTPEGTRTITEPGGAIQGALDLAPLGDRFYFMGRSFTDPNDYQGTPALFRTDGTQAATVPVKTFSPAPTYDTPEPQLTVLDGALFFVASDAGHGGELWRTDGTSTGTALVTDINPGPNSARISGLTAAGGRLFFAADDGEHGIELWTSDGTAAGTRTLSDIAAGPYSSSPREITAIGNLLFFSADDQVIGREPWVLPLDGEVKP